MLLTKQNGIGLCSSICISKELLHLLSCSFFLVQFMELLGEHPKLLLSEPNVTYQGKPLYMQKPEVVEKMTRPNLKLPLFDLMDKVSKDIIHVNGTTVKNDKKTSSQLKLRISFKTSDVTTDVDMASGA